MRFMTGNMLSLSECYSMYLSFKITPKLTFLAKLSVGIDKTQ